MNTIHIQHPANIIPLSGTPSSNSVTMNTIHIQDPANIIPLSGTPSSNSVTVLFSLKMYTVFTGTQIQLN